MELLVRIRGRPQARSESQEFSFFAEGPHNFSVRKLALKAERKNEAIVCDFERRPHFCDIRFFDNCNADTDGLTFFFRHSAAHDSGLAEKTLFTGSDNFTVKEIKVFEITDSPALPNSNLTEI
jgi:hypothetical protein